MKIVRNKAKYVDQLVGIVEEYRVFCGSAPAPEETKKFFLNLLSNEESVTFLAICDSPETVMGFVNLYPSYSTLSLRRLWILNDLGVSSNFRGHGVAKTLINKVLDFAKDTNAVRIELKTQKTNPVAQELYKSLGFEIDKENIYYRMLV